MEQLIVSVVFYLLNIFIVKCEHTYMLIHIGNISKICTLYLNGGTTYDSFYSCIIFLRKGSASAHGCYNLFSSTIICLLRYRNTYFNFKYMSYYCTIYLMVNITINDYPAHNLTIIIYINHDGYK